MSEEQRNTQGENLESKLNTESKKSKKLVRFGTHVVNNVAITKVAEHIATYHLGQDVDKKKLFAASILTSTAAFYAAESIDRVGTLIKQGDYNKAFQEPVVITAAGGIVGGLAGFGVYKMFEDKISQYSVQAPTNYDLPLEKEKPTAWEYIKAGASTLELGLSGWKAGENKTEKFENRTSIVGGLIGAATKLAYDQYSPSVEKEHPGLIRTVAIGAGVGAGLGYAFRKQIAKAIANTQYKRQ